MRSADGFVMAGKPGTPASRALTACQLGDMKEDANSETTRKCLAIALSHALIARGIFLGGAKNEMLE